VVGLRVGARGAAQRGAAAARAAPVLADLAGVRRGALVVGVGLVVHDAVAVVVLAVARLRRVRALAHVRGLTDLRSAGPAGRAARRRGARGRADVARPAWTAVRGRTDGLADPARAIGVLGARRAGPPGRRLAALSTGANEARRAARPPCAARLSQVA